MLQTSKSAHSPLGSANTSSLPAMGPTLPLLPETLSWTDSMSGVGRQTSTNSESGVGIGRGGTRGRDVHLRGLGWGQGWEVEVFSVEKSPPKMGSGMGVGQGGNRAASSTPGGSNSCLGAQRSLKGPMPGYVCGGVNFREVPLAAGHEEVCETANRTVSGCEEGCPEGEDGAETQRPPPSEAALRRVDRCGEPGQQRPGG